MEKLVWKKVSFNKQNIECYSSSACLIKCPNKSDYKGFCFWHPIKLIRDNTLIYNDDFTFKLIKYGKGKYNRREIIDTEEISSCELEDMFEVVDDGESYLKVIEPKKLDFEIKVREELKNE